MCVCVYLCMIVRARNGHPHTKRCTAIQESSTVLRAYGRQSDAPALFCVGPSQWITTSTRCPTLPTTNSPTHNTTTHHPAYSHNYSQPQGLEKSNAEWSEVTWSSMSAVSSESDGGATSRGSVLCCAVLCYAEL